MNTADFTSSKMELDINFFTGLSCGLCLGITIYVLRNRHVQKPSEAPQPTEEKKPVKKKFSSKSEYKMVLVVRNDLKLTKANIMSYCCHAAIGAFEEIQKTDLVSLRLWQNMGQAKVAVKCNSVNEIDKIIEDCKKEGVVCHTVMDEDSTSVTCLAVGPAPKEVIDTITGNLKLL